MQKKYILALDQGTTSSRAILFDHAQNIVGMAQRELTQIFPQEGWVEQDPMEIYSTQYGVIMELLAQTDTKVEDIAAIGITNQRETTIVWDKHTGRPIYNAIVWQCRRTAPQVQQLISKGLTDYIGETTGLLPDAYFSGTKIQWILDHVEGARERSQNGDLLFGTVDSWLVWKLTEKKVHVTDVTNASRTMLFDIHKLNWDDTLLEAMNIPHCMLPEVRSNSEIYGYTTLFGEDIPLAGMAGDQQAALFGQTCFATGEAKNTYGTGCFLLLNTGATPVQSKNGLLTTLGIKIGDEVQYALEGSVFVAGAVVQWLRDEMRMFTESRDAEYHACKVADTAGVYFVPAFTGLGAPHWDMYARGTIVGLTRGTNQAHIIRAALESIAFQSNDLLCAMEADLGAPLTALRVDGGASENGFLMQFQADIANLPIHRPVVRETTALGAAYLAGLAVGFWSSKDELKALWQCDHEYHPAMEAEKRAQSCTGWDKAVGRSKDWIEH